MKQPPLVVISFLVNQHVFLPA